ncbi:hypothetical protein ACJMK2_022202 [Sinanodonta woodiana]|uniref:Uncharacterized protein n=1 Tax=Sinanodonta woodiana TaxID=1069815 RepID=A0ABD3TK76_SINWO
MSEFGDKIQNASSLFSNRYCDTGCIWTRHVINVQLQPNIVAKTALETPRLSFSEGNNSCILMNNTITYTKASEAFRPNRINVTIITSSTNGKSTVANEISKRTTFGLNEDNSSLLAPVGVTTSRNDHESAPHKSDTGIIIGAVIGSFVFLMMIFLGIICIRRGLLQRLKENKSKHVARNTKMRNTDTYDPNQCHDVPLETRSGLTVFAQLESNCEGSKTGILGTISDPRKPASVFDLDGSKFNYETLNRNVYVNSINQNSATNYDDYEHLNRVHEDRDINSQGNMYDSVRFE